MEKQEPRAMNQNPRDSWHIRIDVQHFINTYGEIWWRFSEGKRSRIATQLVKDIGEALKEGKEIKELPEEIKITCLPSMLRCRLPDNPKELAHLKKELEDYLSQPAPLLINIDSSPNGSTIEFQSLTSKI